MTNAESLVHCVTILERIGGVLHLERAVNLLETRKMRRLPV
jgi:hypothetical protein